MKNKIYYTALLNNDDLISFKENKEYYNLLYTKICPYDKNYSIVEYEVLSENPGDLDIEVMLYTLGALLIHEEYTNGFCMLKTDIEELKNIYSWSQSGKYAMANLLTAKERLHILKNKLEKSNKKGTPYLKINTNDGKIKLVDINKNEEVLFFDEGPTIDINNDETHIWFPYLLEEFTNSFFVILDYDLIEEDKNKITQTQKDIDKINSLMNDPLDCIYEF